MTSPAVSPGVMKLDSCSPDEKCMSFQQEPKAPFLHLEQRFTSRLPYCRLKLTTSVTLSPIV